LEVAFGGGCVPSAAFGGVCGITAFGGACGMAAFGGVSAFALGMLALTLGGSAFAFESPVLPETL
jgi:hypothetical protein